MSRKSVEGQSSEVAPLEIGAFVAAILLFSAVLVRYTDNFFADDTYFYLQVAFNLAHGHGSTFNGVMPTNGYHPLWLLVCTAIFVLVPEKIAAVHVTGVVIAVLNTATLLVLRRALLHAGVRGWWWAWLLYVPFCFTSQLGTEGAISAFFLVALVLATLRFTEKSDTQRALLVGVCAACAVLSRLDNIFVVSALFMALVLELRPLTKSTERRLLTAAAVPLLLWTAYMATNLRWFGTLQPISGMLKAHAHGEHTLFSNLPHTAFLDLAISIPCVLLLAVWKRDRFSRLIEIPFAAGVLAHAIYIVGMMSSETRWTWYYTSWTILAAMVFARAASLPLERWPALRPRHEPAIAALLLLAVWYGMSYRRFAHADANVRESEFRERISNGAQLRRVLAFDKPGRIAFYTETKVIPLDGLMGDLSFQRDLAEKGVAAFNASNGVDGFIGPPQPMPDEAKARFCDAIFLSSVRFHCQPAGDHLWRVDAVEVFSRLGGESAGWIALPARDLVWSAPGQVAVWRLGSPTGTGSQ